MTEGGAKDMTRGSAWARDWGRLSYKMTQPDKVFSGKIVLLQ